MTRYKRSRIAFGAVALAVAASIVACAVPGQGTPAPAPLPTWTPLLATLPPPDTATPVPTDTEVPPPPTPVPTTVVSTATLIPVPTATQVPPIVITVAPASGVTLSSPDANQTKVYDDAPCAPLEVEFSITASPLSLIKSVFLFTGLPWFGSPYERWDPGTAMKHATGSTRFWVTVNHDWINKRDMLHANPGFDHTKLSYQFVAVDVNGVYVRSPVYTDITYYECH